MKDKIFYDCYNKQQESGGTKPYWNELVEKYKDEGYDTKEKIRSAYKREKKHRMNTGEIPSNLDYQEKTSYEEGDDFINIVCSSRRLLSKEDLLDEFNVNTDIWEVERYRIKTSEGYRKDREVQWEVSDGKVTHGHVNDTGKMLVVPLYHVEVRLIRKEQKYDVITIDKLFEKFNSKNFSPKKVVPSQSYSNGVSIILPIADLHFGLVATKEVEGEVYNVELAEKYFYDIIEQTKRRLEGMRIKKIYFLLGNDLFNSDNINSTTTRGTPQDSEYSWFHLVDKANEMIICGINSLREIADIEVINIPSNHDRHTTYGVIKMVEQYFRTVQNVSFDNRPIYTKYLAIGKTLVGLTHDIPKKRALETFTTDPEAKKLWSNVNQAIWILAHLHNAMQYEREGIMEIYRLPAISGRSRWTTEQHFTQPDRRAQIFVLDDDYGVLDVMNIFIR